MLEKYHNYASIGWTLEAPIEGWSTDLQRPMCWKNYHWSGGKADAYRKRDVEIPLVEGSGSGLDNSPRHHLDDQMTMIDYASTTLDLLSVPEASQSSL